MEQTLATLHNDHRNYSRLLAVLKSDLDKLQDSANPDFIRLYDIMNYMTNYPDVSHHPVEEIIFNILKKISPDSSDLIYTLTEEHRELARLGLTLKEKLNHIISGSIVSKEAIIETSNNYYQLLTNHMNTEESQVFPIIENTFTKDNWSQLGMQIDDMGDPLFGDVVQEQFTDLYKRITLSKDDVI
jgi:hemerythrin-like domain-containing protein